MTKKIIIFTQNTMASIVATREIIIKNHDKISIIVLADQIKGGSLKKQFKIIKKLIKKSSFSFFYYKIIESKLYNLLLTFHKLIKSKKYLSSQAKTITGLAKQYNIPIIKTDNLSDEEFLNTIKEFNPNYIICLVAQILRKTVFEVLGDKIINAHGSYLPKYRGAAQYFWYLFNDDEKFGVTVHFMEPGLDTGDIIFQKEFNYKQDISAYKLHYGIAKIWGEMLNEFIVKYSILNKIPREKQDNEKATLTRMPTSEDMRLFKKRGKKMLSIKDFFKYV